MVCARLYALIFAWIVAKVAVDRFPIATGVGGGVILFQILRHKRLLALHGPDPKFLLCIVRVREIVYASQSLAPRTTPVDSIFWYHEGKRRQAFAYASRSIAYTDLPGARHFDAQAICTDGFQFNKPTP
tara:strand:- start:31 stop:417 length:387 start_codon:yes stop_codon:yes gene_type:complete